MSNVVPIRDPWKEAFAIIERLNTCITDVPGDDLTPGFQLLEETRTDIRELAGLLRESARLVQCAIERETPRFEAHSRRYYEGGE